MRKREVMAYDVAIIGAGPAGLSAAIRLKQLNPALSVCVLEKGASVGAHILSGAVIDPKSLNELLPDWKERGAPVRVAVSEDAFYYLSQARALKLPTPPQMKNEGNYIISLGMLCHWLGEQAEALGVEIFPGFPAVDAIIEEGRLCGVITGDFGRAADGTEKAEFQPGVEIRAKFTLLAEGCRGSLSERLMKEFYLREKCVPQTYALGIKEIWEIDSSKHKEGLAVHTVGWPLPADTYGGSFIYHTENNRVSLGLITGLDYANPYLDPYQEFQRFKTHPFVASLLEGGKRIAYGARSLNEGGLQSLPALSFAGGALLGCSAGFLNVPRIKGSHLAMKSGMLAAESVVAALAENKVDLDYETRVRESWMYAELYTARNIRPAFRHGLLAGIIYSALDTYIFRGKAPWTFRHTKPDNAQLETAARSTPIAYSKPDGNLTFDRMSSVYLSNTNHTENQPVHLVLKDKNIPVECNLPVYAAPEQRYCPAGVYEIVQKEGNAALQINAQNCVHCKACDIKDPTQNIVWTPPEGGGGPNYQGM